MTIVAERQQDGPYPCARCDQRFATATEADAHMDAAHQLRWQD